MRSDLPCRSGGGNKLPKKKKTACHRISSSGVAAAILCASYHDSDWNVEQQFTIWLV
jgi:hypothetical protein